MKATDELWLERIREWKASGLSARQFAEGKPYKASSLTWRQWQLHHSSGGAPTKREAKVKRPPQRRSRSGARSALQPVNSAMAIAEVIRRPSPVKPTLDVSRSSAVVVEVGQVRINVGCGFSASLLRDVVRALQGAA
jgi:hypothetical protein